MNYITAFDIRLSKDVYYSGDNVSGNVILENSRNIHIKDIRVILRGKAHIKLNKTGEKRTIQDDQYILNEKLILWNQGKFDEKDEPILLSGLHHFPFQFQLPNCSMPCSLETKFGTIRYYVKVIINIPHGSMPQGIKYFTIIGPSTDCMDEKYCCALLGQNKEVTWHGCCRRGALALRVIMDRTAYLCGENVRILAHVENRQNGIVWIVMRLIQHVEYFMGKNVGENKQIDCVVLESKTLPVEPYTQGKFDTAQLQSFVIPVVPPTLIGVCRLLQIFYACIEDEKGNETLQMEFPLTIATLPFLKATMPKPILDYDTCCPHAEGGRYISPEFQIGRIHDGENLGLIKQSIDDHTVLYRPLYVYLVQQQSDLSCCDIDTQYLGHQVIFYFNKISLAVQLKDLNFIHKNQ
uniref:BMA-ARRD-6 n=1 Tax=Brugia malayi TaxID=6279 RepID=A0A0J9Y6F9_BRUMA|nr:BMA-ARRD-6 [Brugia malayi]